MQQHIQQQIYLPWKIFALTLQIFELQTSPQTFKFVPSAVTSANRRSYQDAHDAMNDEVEPASAQAQFTSSSSFPHYAYGDGDNGARKGAALSDSPGGAGVPDEQWGAPWLSGMANVLSQPFSLTKENDPQSSSSGGGFDNIFSFGKGGNAKR